jgi:hypothetical protein
VAAGLEELAYSLALRALSQQEKVLEELRARTGTLLAATAIVASFLGARALGVGGEQVLGIVGVVFAIGSILMSVYTLVPKRNLDFALAGPAVYEHFMKAGADVDEAYRTLSYWIQSAWDENQIVIDGLIRAFRWACWSLALAVGFWSLALTLD